MAKPTRKPYFLPQRLKSHGGYPEKRPYHRAYRVLKRIRSRFI